MIANNNWKIIFYEKEVKLAYPNYAIKLLKELQNRGGEVFVLFGKPINYNRPKDNSKEEIANVYLEEIYHEFKHYRLQNWNGLKNIIHSFKPDILISSLALFDFEREILEYASLKSIKILEMDTIASEIMTYNYYSRVKNYVYLGFGGGIKNLTRLLLARLQIQPFLPKKLQNSKLFRKQYKIIADRITIRGEWLQRFLTYENRHKYPKSLFPVTGSIQLDALCTQIVSKENLFKTLGYNYSCKTILILPTAKSVDNSKDDFFLKSVIESLAKDRIYNMAIQPHPADRVLYPDRFSKYKEFVIKPTDFYPILQHADIVISPRSSVFFETAITKTPLIFAHHQKNHIELPVISKNYKIVEFAKASNVMNKIEDILNNKIKFNYDNFISEFCYSDDGLSYKRVADEIVKLVNI